MKEVGDVNLDFFAFARLIPFFARYRCKLYKPRHAKLHLKHSFLVANWSENKSFRTFFWCGRIRPEPENEIQTCRRKPSRNLCQEIDNISPRERKTPTNLENPWSTPKDLPNFEKLEQKTTSNGPSTWRPFEGGCEMWGSPSSSNWISRSLSLVSPYSVQWSLIFVAR